jgi:hypothetical protein
LLNPLGDIENMLSESLLIGSGHAIANGGQVNGREAGYDGMSSPSLMEDPEWKRKLLMAREQVVNCAEGKLTLMYVQYAADAGQSVFDTQGRSAFVRGWAKEKGLLVSVCWEAFNELREFMPMVSFVKVYGSADSVVSTITTKYTQQAKYRDRKGGDAPGSKGSPIDFDESALNAHNPTAAHIGTSAEPLREGNRVYVNTKAHQPPRYMMEGIVKEVNHSEGVVSVTLKAIIDGLCTHKEVLGAPQVRRVFCRAILVLLTRA